MDAKTETRKLWATRSDGAKVIHTGNDKNGFRIGYMLLPNGDKTPIAPVDQWTKIGTFKFEKGK